MIHALLSTADKTLMVRVPLAFRKRCGRRLVLAPEGSAPFSRRTRIDNSVIKALARAFRWRKLIESGECASIEDVAAYDGINPSYVGRVLRMALLAPDIVEAILDGRQGPEVTLARLMRPFPSDWNKQRKALGVFTVTKPGDPQFQRNSTSLRGGLNFDTQRGMGGKTRRLG